MRLTKRDAEALLSAYDRDQLGALTTALGRILELPSATWPELLAAAPLSATRRQQLLELRPAALDALVGELNEVRYLAGPS